MWLKVKVGQVARAVVVVRTGAEAGCGGGGGGGGYLVCVSSLLTFNGHISILRLFLIGCVLFMLLPPLEFVVAFAFRLYLLSCA